MTDIGAPQGTQELLPHRYPFLLVDRVLDFEPGERLVATKNVTSSEPHFTGHFPDRPIMPGVLLCEALAQAGGLLVHATIRGNLEPVTEDERIFIVLTSLDGVRFRRQVVPGDQVRLEVSLKRTHRPLWKFEGRATVGGVVAAEASFSMVEVAEDGDRPPVRAETKIHPTAIVEPGAQLAAGVEVGPYAYVGGSVRVGERTRILHHANVDGHTTIGSENVLSPFSSVGSEPQDRKYEGEPGRLIMGDRNHVREFASLSIGTEAGGMETTIGNDNLFMNASHVGHDCHIGNHTTLVNGVPLAGHVTVEDHAIISGLAAVAQFVRLGQSSFVGGGAMVVMDVPPFCIANGDRASLKGLNVVGLERRGLDADQIKDLKKAYRILFQSKLVVADAVERVRAELPESTHAAQLADFVAESGRGVTRP